MSEQQTGRLYGVGLGPGDPSLMTVRAMEVIAEADVIAYHSARHGRSIARSIAERHLRPDHIEERLVYPVPRRPPRRGRRRAPRRGGAPRWCRRG
ncbi:hypothetical protein SANTM175S_00347 [Streptomyces antimycoticus]